MENLNVENEDISDNREDMSDENPLPQSELQITRVGAPPKPFKMNNLFFECMADYNAYLLSEGRSAQNGTRVRRKLNANSNNPNSDSRYLTESEIEEARSSNTFIKIERNTSP